MQGFHKIARNDHVQYKYLGLTEDVRHLPSVRSLDVGQRPKSGDPGASPDRCTQAHPRRAAPERLQPQFFAPRALAANYARIFTPIDKSPSNRDLGFYRIVIRMHAAVRGVEQPGGRQGLDIRVDIAVVAPKRLCQGADTDDLVPTNIA